MVLGKGDAELLSITVTNNSIIGKKIGDISPNPNYIIVSVYENGKITIPMQDTIIKDGVKLSVLIKKDYIKKIIDLFTK